MTNGNRQTANEELLEILSDLIKKNPNERFHQILRNYGFISQGPIDPVTHSPTWINDFSTEPEQILVRVKAAIKQIDSQLTKKN